MASRRLKSDRFFTRDFTPDVYTPEGLSWVEDTTMVDVLLRHHPELAPALEGVENAFAPWKRVWLSERSAAHRCSRTSSFNQAVVAAERAAGDLPPAAERGRGATRLDVDGQAIGFLRGLRRSLRRPAPSGSASAARRRCCCSTSSDVRRVLEGSPTRSRRTPTAKGKGHGPLPARRADDLARRPLWEERRRFTEAVLDTGEQRHPRRALRRRRRRGDRSTGDAAAGSSGPTGTWPSSA